MDTEVSAAKYTLTTCLIIQLHISDICNKFSFGAFDAVCHVTGWHLACEKSLSIVIECSQVKQQNKRAIG